MEEGFGHTWSLPNCAFSVFDIEAGGRAFNRVREYSFDPPVTPAFEVATVGQRDRDGHSVINVEVLLDSTTYLREMRLSEMRASLSDVIEKGMPEVSYTHYQLNGTFPARGLSSKIKPALSIQDWLEQLSVAMGDANFPAELAEHVKQWIRGECAVPQLEPEQVDDFEFLPAPRTAADTSVELHAASATWPLAVQAPRSAFQVKSVTQRAQKDRGHCIYDVQVSIDGVDCVRWERESAIKSQLHDVVKKNLAEGSLYQKHGLAGKFPSFTLRGDDPAARIRQYLELLAVAMADPEFPLDCASHVYEWLSSNG